MGLVEEMKSTLFKKVTIMVGQLSLQEKSTTVDQSELVLPLLTMLHLSGLGFHL